MKKKKHIAIGIFLGILIGSIWGINSNQTNNLTILHTNDLHSHFLPVDTNMQDCAQGTECYGGFARLQTLINQERKNGEQILLLDAGDRFSGTYFYTLHHEQDLIPVFQKLNYDAWTLGNHEFDDGLNVLGNFLTHVNTPTVCTNIILPEGTIPAQKTLPSFVLTKNNVKIGLLGAITENVRTSSMYGDSVQLKPLIQSLKTEIDNMEKQGIHFIILLSHLGLDKDIEVAHLLPEIDIIIGGHSHELLSNTYSGRGPYPFVVQNKNDQTLIVTTGAFGRFLGKLNIQINQKGKITNYQGDTVPLADTISTNTEIQQFINEKEQQLKNQMDKKIGVLVNDIPMTQNKDFCSHPCPIGDFITQTLLKKIQNIDVVLINSGAIRAGLPKGEITQKNLLQMMPFDGTLVSVRMSGENLKKYLEHGLNHFQENQRTNTFLQMAGGQYDFDLKTGKITSLIINGKPVQPTKIYRIVLLLFLAKGGDNFPIQTNYITLPQNAQQIIADFLQQQN